LVFQSFALFPWLTARGNILFGLRRQVLPRGGRDRRVGELLDLARLGDRADLYPYQLSGGEQQRVAIARCLAAEPRVVLMDEPFGSLDAFTREELQAEIIRLWSKLGTTIIFVTHDIREAIFLGRRIVILGGRPASVVESIRTRDWIGPRAQGAACIDGCGDAPDVHTLSGELPDEDRVAHATRDPSIRYTTGFVRLEQHLSDRLRARAGDAC
jgi:ABC-type nitrate/sulfonate/bicarbonate transport system ATPase subunit